MGKCHDFLHSVCSYSTPKIVNIHSLTVGFLSRLVQLAIISYIIGYVLVYKKGYQQVSMVESSVTTKVKGIAFTNFSNEEFNPDIKDPDLYRRIWDVADYVVPPSENGATFVATNVIITPNQTLSVCPEDIDVPGARCDPENNTCVAGQPIPLGNGVMTGNCVKFNKTKGDKDYSCEIHAWCPVENDELPLKNGTAILSASKEFTLLIKNFVNFPLFKNATRRNIRDTANKTYLQNCIYDSDKNPDCPIFKLGDIVEMAGQDYDHFSIKGGIIAIVINWNCNLDFDKKHCFPKYSFTRLDDPDALLAPGWNFRYAHYYSDGSRTLYKLYGIKFTIIVEGQAGKFFIIPLLLNLGAGLGLLAIEGVICDMVVLYMMKKRQLYKTKKYEIVDLEDDGECSDPENKFVVVQPKGEASASSSQVINRNVEDGYQRLTD